MFRRDGRQPHELRPLRIIPGVSPYAEGSCRIEMGNTHVLCVASVEAGVPPWLRDEGRGWITAEYALLPRATHTRTRRERNGPSGRTQEIQRLIGRSLRMAADLFLLGDYTITIDCDVLQADGGTRTAAITGGYVALALAIQHMQTNGLLGTNPLRRAIAAVSVGMVENTIVLDLDYSEDSTAEVDGNIVQTGSGEIIEVQSTAERTPINRQTFDDMLDMAHTGIATLLEQQQAALQTNAT